MQQVHILKKVLFSRPRGILDSTLYDEVGQGLTHVSAADKTDRNDITEILLKVALHTYERNHKISASIFVLLLSFIACLPFISITFGNPSISY